MARGVHTLGAVLDNARAVPEALEQLHASNVEAKSAAIMKGCKREATSSSEIWGATSHSARDLLQKAQGQSRINLPCTEVDRLLGNALRPGAGLLEVCGLPGAGKTQFCLQLCAAAQLGDGTAASIQSIQSSGPSEAVYIDTEGSFVPARYAQICGALLRGTGSNQSLLGAAYGLPSKTLVEQTGNPMLEATLRSLFVCRPYDAAELYATVKNMGSFLQRHPRVRVLVLDSIAFCFRHELTEDAGQRVRVLTDIAATLRNYAAERNLVVVVTNHMTTRFDRTSGNLGADDELAWLAPALGETWAHQPTTQMRLDRSNLSSAMGQSTGRATLTKSIEKATGRTCLYQITEVGLRDVRAVTVPTC